MVAKAKEVATQDDVRDPFMDMVERLSKIPDLKAETIDQVLRMQERIMDRNAEAEFAEAMVRVQQNLPQILKTSENKQTNSRYAKHEYIAKIIKPIYTEEGFSITFSEDDSPKEKHIRVVGILRHRAGYKERHHIDVAIDDSGIKGNVNKTLTHAEGSSQTYGRRRLTCMMFDVATGDDNDGNGAKGDPVTHEQKRTLEQLIRETKTNLAAFLEWGGVDDLAKLPAAKFNDAMAKLNTKKRAKAAPPEKEREPGEEG